MTTAKEKRAQDRLIDRAYSANCNGIAINMLDIPKVFAVGRARLEAGASYNELVEAIKAFVAKIRVN